MESKSHREGAVCFLQKSGEILLLLLEYPKGKKVWSGVGGMVDGNESPEEAVVREGKEELNIEIDKQSLRKAAIVHENPEFSLHVYTTTNWSGEPTSYEPTIKDVRWFPSEKIPYQQMWIDNKFWLPYILNGKLLIATVLKDVYNNEEMTAEDIQIIEQQNLT